MPFYKIAEANAKCAEIGRLPTMTELESAYQANVDHGRKMDFFILLLKLPLLILDISRRLSMLAMKTRKAYTIQRKVLIYAAFVTVYFVLAASLSNQN